MSTAADRYVEGDRVEVDVTIDLGPAGGGMRAELVLPAAAWDGSGTFATTGRREAAVAWSVRPRRWGRRSLGPVRLTAWGPSRLDVATGEVTLARIDVHPPAAWARHLPLPPRLVQRAGLHAGRAEAPASSSPVSGPTSLATLCGVSTGLRRLAGDVCT